MWFDYCPTNYRRYPSHTLQRTSKFIDVTTDIWNTKESIIYNTPNSSIITDKMINYKERVDRKYKVIIENLISNAREPITNISKKIRLSKSSTLNRLNNLIKRGVISKFVTVIDFKNLGYFTKIIFLKVNLTENILKELENLDFYIGISTTSSFYNVTITVIAKDMNEFQEQLSKLYLITKYADIKVSTISRYETPPYNLFGIKINQRKEKEDKQKTKVDKIDIQILECLEEEARIPASKIANKLNVDSKTIINRMKKLKKEGIIKAYHTIFNSLRMGYSPYNIIFKIKRKEFVNKVYDFIKNESLCYLAAKLEGEYDLIGTFLFNDNNKIKGFLDKLHKMFKNIDIETEVTVLFEFRNKFLPNIVIKNL